MEEPARESFFLNDVHIVSAGQFGSAVSKYLISFGFGVRESHWNGRDYIGVDEFLSTGVEVIAASRPLPTLGDFVSTFCQEHCKPLIPVILDSSVLRVGPIIVPGLSGCWQCWKMRSLQHSGSLEEKRALLSFYERNQALEPCGFLEPFAMIGAAHIAATLQSWDILKQKAGSIWQIDLFTKEVAVGFLVGVDGCQHCGLDRPLDNRTYAVMKTELAYLWKDSQNAE